MNHKLQKIDLQDLPLGKPLNWPLYDQLGRLLFNEGTLSTEQIQALCEEGLFRECTTAPIAVKKPKNSQQENR